MIPRTEYFTVKVTTTEEYAFPVYSDISPEELVKQYFDDFDINRSHASRDGGSIGHSKKLISTEILPNRFEM
jgi:hypothetical protein